MERGAGARERGRAGAVEQERAAGRDGVEFVKRRKKSTSADTSTRTTRYRGSEPNGENTAEHCRCYSNSTIPQLAVLHGFDIVSASIARLKL